MCHSALSLSVGGISVTKPQDIPHGPSPLTYRPSDSLTRTAPVSSHAHYVATPTATPTTSQDQATRG